MPFVKGKSGNPLGRPRHTAVDEIRSQLQIRKKNLIEEAFECLDEIKEPTAKINMIFKLMEFMYSKPKETEISLEQAVEIVKRAIQQRESEKPPERPRKDEVSFQF